MILQTYPQFTRNVVTVPMSWHLTPTIDDEPPQKTIEATMNVKSYIFLLFIHFGFD